MTPAFLTGLDQLKQMEALSGYDAGLFAALAEHQAAGVCPEAALSQPAAAVPDGWVLVPRVLGADLIAKVRNHGVWTEQEVRNLHSDLLAAAPQAPQQAETWRPIETAPKDGRKLIIAYRNRNNKARTVMASWLTDEQAAETDADGVGLEGGWYECIDNWPDYTEVAIHEGEPTHWQPLPAPPTTPAG